MIPSEHQPIDELRLLDSLNEPLKQINDLALPSGTPDPTRAVDDLDMDVEGGSNINTNTTSDLGRTSDPKLENKENQSPRPASFIMEVGLEDL